MTKNIKYARIFVLILSISFLVLGVSLDQHHSTFQKAIRICLECIGIG